MTRRGAFVMVLTALLCAQVHAATRTQGSLSIGGKTRSYILFKPDGFDPAKRYPIVLGLHGGLGNGQRFAQQSALPQQVDRLQFIGVFPDSAGQQWNDGRATTRSGTDDVAFLVRLIETVAANDGGDARRVFVTGISNGGMMAQRLACDAAGAIAAVAAVAANLPADLAASCHPQRAVPIIFFSGDADPLMPFAGGDITKSRFAGAGGKALSVAQTVAFWAQANGCRTERTEALPDRADDGTHVSLHRFETCAGAPVLLYEIKGGGHTWPGGAEPKLDFVRRIVGPTSKDVDATQTILAFFGTFGLTPR